MYHTHTHEQPYTQIPASKVKHTCAHTVPPQPEGGDIIIHTKANLVNLTLHLQDPSKLSAPVGPFCSKTSYKHQQPQSIAFGHSCTNKAAGNSTEIL